jgi:hypothetical protein
MILHLKNVITKKRDSMFLLCLTELGTLSAKAKHKLIFLRINHIQIRACPCSFRGVAFII